MTKYMSEEEIEQEFTELRVALETMAIMVKAKHHKMTIDHPLRKIKNQAKLASSAIAEAKALRALIEGLDPIYFHDKHTLIRDLKADAKKIPLLQQGEDK